MSNASAFPRLDALGATILNSAGIPYVDAAALRAALISHSNFIPSTRVIPVGNPTVASGWPAFQIERALNGLSGSNASFGPTLGPILYNCP